MGYKNASIIDVTRRLSHQLKAPTNDLISRTTTTSEFKKQLTV